MEPMALYGYLAASALLLIAAGTEALFGIKAERQSLESISTPLSAAGEESVAA